MLAARSNHYRSLKIVVYFVFDDRSRFVVLWCRDRVICRNAKTAGRKSRQPGVCAIGCLVRLCSSRVAVYDYRVRYAFVIRDTC
jgi:hypothetical protein